MVMELKGLWAAQCETLRGFSAMAAEITAARDEVVTTPAEFRTLAVKPDRRV